MSGMSLHGADIPVIAVMGVAGAGKSTFIKKATGSTEIMVGHGPNPTTDELAIFSTRIEGHKVALLDTIGFDNTRRSDTEVLKEIARGLTRIHVQGIRLAGILYLHNIASPQYYDTGVKARQIFEKLVGEEQFSNVTLVTTHWDIVDITEGLERTEELRKTYNMWEATLDGGSTFEPFYGTPEGARNVLRKILARERSTVLSIQREIVDQQLALSKTAAGKLIREEIERSQAQLIEQLTKLRCKRKRPVALEYEGFLKMLEALQMGLDQQIAGGEAQLAELETEKIKLSKEF